MREKKLRNRIEVATYKCSTKKKKNEDESIDTLRETLISEQST